MKLYRLHYGEDITQGIYQGKTGSEEYNIWALRRNMKLSVEFSINMYEGLHCPKMAEFLKQPSRNSLFYFKEDFFNMNKHIIDDLVFTASKLDITINLKVIELDDITVYNCIYQDENQMCLEIEQGGF